MVELKSVSEQFTVLCTVDLIVACRLTTIDTTPPSIGVERFIVWIVFGGQLVGENRLAEDKLRRLQQYLP